MALALFDRVQETSTTAGTGSIILAGAVSGFQSFAVVGNGNTCYYTIVDGSAWEVGVGTYSTSGPTLARTTILSNSNGNTSPLTLTANSKSVFLTYPASKSVNLNESGNVSPLGTVVSGIWNGTTIGVAYGGTGVTASSGANSVVLRDSNQNVAVNRVNQANTNTTAAGGTTALTAASSYIHTLVGTGGQTYSLPDATTLTTGVAFVFNNLATGTLTIANYAGTTIGTIPSGGAGAVFLTLNSTVGGTWDLHAYLPEGVTFGTNAFNLGTSIISGGTWQGGTIQTGYGGTGLTSYTSGGAVYANSSSTLTSGTLPLTAGGTGNTSGQAASTASSATFNSGGAGDASGTTFNGSAARTISYNTIGAPSTTGTNASGTWGINITGNASSSSYATYVYSQDIRTLSPSSTSAYRLGFGFTSWANNNTAPYADYLALRSYSDASGGNDNLVTFNKSTIAMRVWQQSFGSASAYSSYADVLMSNNYNSYAPTLTGGGASGTWGINITGSAGSAPGYLPLSGGTMTGSLAFAQGANINFGSSTNEAGPWTISVIGSGGATPATKGTGYGRNLIVKAGNSDNGGGLAGGDLYLRAGAPTAPATTYGVVYLSDDGGFTQAGGSLRAPIFYDSNNTAYYVDAASTSNLNAVNFNGVLAWADGTYALGSPSYGFRFNDTASSINAFIIANSGDTTSWTSSRAPIFYDRNNTGYYVDPASTSVIRKTNLVASGSGWDDGLNLYSADGSNRWNLLVDQGASNWLRFAYNQSEKFYIRPDGAVIATTDIRAPIFYDNNNTGYYLDPASTSELNKVYYNSNMVSRNYGIGQVGLYASTRFQAVFSMGEAYLLPADGTTAGNLYGIAWSYPSAGGVAANLNTHGALFLENGGFLAAVSGSIRCRDDMRAPVFYDSNDTGYYLNPNGSSLLYGIVLSGNMYFRPNSWIQMDGSYGMYWPNHYGAHFYPNAGSTYTQLQIDGSKNSYSGMYISHSAVNGMMYDGAGNGGVYREANGRWFWYHNVANNCMGVGTSNAPSAYGIYVVKGGYFDGRVDGTIFYDANNTGYYLDPNGTSNLNQVNLAGFLRRNTSTAGYLEGNYPASVDGNSSSCIYTIGGAYQPGGTNMGNMYGIGYTVGNGTTNPGLGMTGWGLYVASGGTSRIFLDSDAGTGVASSSWRASIFYDRDNTGYYLDPTSTTALRTVGSWRADSAAWDGEFNGKIQYHSNNWYFQYLGSMLFRNSGGSNVFTVDQSGNAVASGNVTAYSDVRLKENIVTIDSALDKVLHLRGVYYNKIGNPERRVGVIAQEVLEIIPEVVRSVSDTNPSTGETTELLAVDYGNITGLLIEAVKQLSAKVDELQRRA